MKRVLEVCRARFVVAMITGCLTGVGLHAQAGQPGQADTTDKYVWLEDVSGARSMAWVKAENARTAAVLEADPHYTPNFTEALKIAEDPSRLPMPQLRGDAIYNLWRDKANPRGLLRKTTITSYLTAAPSWQTVLDFDALGRNEKVGWVPKTRPCLYPGDQFCMQALSVGGEDATTEREFNLKTGQFVSGGFVLPHSKQSVSWLDKDTLLVARNWGAGTMTTSGYPFVVKQWKRGTPLESAQEVFRGDPGDQVQSQADVLHDAQGHRLVTFVRGVTFFEFQTFVQTEHGVERLAVPLKASITGLLNGRLLIHLRQDWQPGAGQPICKAGSLVELQLADVMKDPAHLKPSVVFEPTAHEFLESAYPTKSHLLLTTLKDVQGRAYIYTPAASGWTRSSLALPDNVQVDIASVNETNDRYFVSVAGFLTPPAVWLGDAEKGTLTEARSQPPQFDASKDSVQQFFIASKDGTRIPYFVVGPKGMKLDGSHPTLLTAYGGFEVSNTPYYSANLGKLWLEQGGVYVLANIRGGGEFGPAWHEAGLKTHRQRIYDDFAAVGQDLVRRGITSPPHLGIIGGSNGGLLMGVEMEQHPDLWKAVVIQVPLLDMLRFEQIAAGASWVGEYGSASVPEERAFLAGISPYNQLKPDVKYPEPLIFTTTRDDRVGPQHARKFAAKMEEFHLPFFYDEIVEGGHGSGADLKQTARTYAVTYTYLDRELTP